MVHKIYFTPMPSEPYFTFDGHIRKAVRSKYGSIRHDAKTTGPILELVKEHLCSLLKLDHSFQLQIIRPSQLWEMFAEILKVECLPQFINADYWKAQWLSQHPGARTKQDSKLGKNSSNFDLIGSADPLSGSVVVADDLEDVVEKPRVLDITYTFPLVPDVAEEAELIMLQTNAAMGLPFPLIILLCNKKHAFSEQLVKSYQSDISHFEISILHQIINDYVEKGKVQIEREIKYKAAVINQAIERVGSITLAVPLKQTRSANLLKVKLENTDNDAVKALSEKGYILTEYINLVGEKTMLIANFPTHSKEQMEILADEIASLK